MKAEYRFPTKLEWVREYATIPGLFPVENEVMGVYHAVDELVKPIATSDYPRPTFQPERPALVLEALQRKTSERGDLTMLEGGIAYAVSMAKMRVPGNEAHRSRCFGIDFMHGLIILQYPFQVSEITARYMDQVLDEAGVPDKNNARGFTGVADVVLGWRKHNPDQPFKDWLFTKDLDDMRAIMNEGPAWLRGWPIKYNFPT